MNKKSGSVRLKIRCASRRSVNDKPTFKAEVRTTASSSNKALVDANLLRAFEGFERNKAASVALERAGHSGILGRRKKLKVIDD